MSNQTNFWTNAPTRDPKRQFRFRVRIPGIDSDYIWYAKKAEKPTLTFGEAEHQYLNHRYYWPGRAEWNTITVTLVDPVDPNLGGNMAALAEAAGYTIPKDSRVQRTASKSSSTNVVGVVEIEQIDEEGIGLEKWTLNNAWIQELTWGELSYDSDELTECTIKFRYDWASMEIGSQGGDVSGAPFFIPKA